MTRMVTQQQEAVSRRACIAAATEQMVAAMEEFVRIQGEMTVCEWMQVFHGLSGRMLATGLKQDWDYMSNFTGGKK
ncbi:MAG: hypothetical protein DWB56_06875 [Candidatus Jettenia sp.]|nr:MAG: hypothetical protein EDM77_03815 [Candidatus Jettenia sp. AMX1]MBC6928677.1 hypothetical protein [Candidatus Jettenia sp.]MCE7879989.1 hypothetical protein [Candidatus Jettenia sp. AMX1]MCQ3926771.1 hypothetical protein [Candidatus Jettenia sp.]